LTHVFSSCIIDISKICHRYIVIDEKRGEKEKKKMFYDPLSLFATVMLLIHHALEQREKASKPKKPHILLQSKKGRYMIRRLGIFLMRTGGRLVYLGSTYMNDRGEGEHEAISRW
jgi:hypothetical protein